MLILKLALKNIATHKAKTILVGVLLIVATTIMIVGNSIMDTAREASIQAWRQCYAADLMVRPKYSDQQVTVLGFLYSGTKEKVRPIKNYEEVKNALESDSEVVATSPAVGNWSRFDFGTDKYSGGFATGIDPVLYQKVYTRALNVVEGTFLERGQEGLMVVDSVIKQVREVLKIDVKIGDTITVSSIWGGTPRQLPLVGIYKYNTGNRMFQMSGFVDLKSARKLGQFGLKNTTVAPSADQTKSMALISESGSIDDLFGDGELTKTINSATGGLDVLSADQKDAIKSRIDESVPDGNSGDFMFSTIRLKDGVLLEPARERLQKLVQTIDPGIEVVTWSDASGGFAEISEIVRIIFIVLVVVLSLVTVFIIANALLISVTQRTSEIGTMRSLGAQKGFIRKVFLTESMVMTFGFGAIGVVLAILILGILSMVGIHLNDGFTAGMFGSSVLNPVLSISSIFYSIFILLMVGLFSSLAPIAKALKLRIVEALGR